MERRESVQRQVFSQRIVARAALQGCVEGFFGDAERSETIAYMRVSRECIQRRRGIGRISGPCEEENCRPSGTYNRHNSPGRPWAGCSPTHSSGCPRFEEKKASRRSVDVIILRNTLPWGLVPQCTSSCACPTFRHPSSRPRCAMVGDVTTVAADTKAAVTKYSAVFLGIGRICPSP
jgi:hypothetical protein